MLALTDYRLQVDRVDWPDVLATWAWLLPREFTVWFVNRFGDMFMVVEDGSVRMLDVGAGSLVRVADSRDHFAKVIEDENNANNWLMIPLVDELVGAGVTLGPGECYSYVQLPVLGGDYTVANTRVLPIERHYEAFGPIHERIKDLPDGTRVEFDVTGRRPV